MRERRITSDIRPHKACAPRHPSCDGPLPRAARDRDTADELHRHARCARRSLAGRERRRVLEGSCSSTVMSTSSMPAEFIDAASPGRPRRWAAPRRTRRRARRLEPAWTSAAGIQRPPQLGAMVAHALSNPGRPPHGRWHRRTSMSSSRTPGSRRPASRCPSSGVWRKLFGLAFCKGPVSPSATKAASGASHTCWICAKCVDKARARAVPPARGPRADCGRRELVLHVD